MSLSDYGSLLGPIIQSSSISTSAMAVRRHRKNLSLNDANFLHNGTPKTTRVQTPVTAPTHFVITPDSFIHNAVRFLPYAVQLKGLVNRQLERGFGLDEDINNGHKQEDEEENEGLKFTLNPGDNFLMMEAQVGLCICYNSTMQSKLHLIM